METFDFGQALVQLKNGGQVARQGWNGVGQFITAQFPDDLSFMTQMYLYITTVQGERVPWVASQSDLLMDDWYTVE